MWVWFVVGDDWLLVVVLSRSFINFCVITLDYLLVWVVCGFVRALF